MKKLRFPAFLKGKNRPETVLHAVIAVLIVYFLGGWLLAVTAARYPRALMWLVRPLNHTWLPALWLTACAVLWKMILTAFRIAQVRFTAFERQVLLGAIVCTGALYAAVILGRNVLYYWDYSYYYYLQLKLEAAFLTGVREGFAFFYQYLMENDYTPVINLFTEFPFCLTGRTEDAYLLSSFLTIMPALLTLSAGWIVRLRAQWQVWRTRAFYALSLFCVASFPLLHAAYLHGQPDVCGLVFALLVLLLTQGYAFERWETKRLVILFCATLLLFVSRRWYAFWAAAYFVCYAVWAAVRALRQGDSATRRAALLRLAGFGAGSALLGCALLFPMIRHALTFDYANSYSFYNYGGMDAELGNQARYLGGATVVGMALGLIWGVWNRRSRTDTLLAACALLGALFGFTRIQNMGMHQALLLAPSYLTALILLAAAVCNLRGGTLFRIGAGTLGAGLAVNMAASLIHTPALREGSVLTGLSLSMEDRADIAAVREIDRWLLAHCSAEADVLAYMIPHGTRYNPDVFRYALSPDLAMLDILDYGFAVPGAHRFPAELLDARYVLTCDPFDNTGLAERYNEIFLHNGYLEQRFQTVLTMDMHNGVTFTVYERIVPVDRAEVETYRAGLLAENEAYPALIGDVLDAYIAYHHLG